MDHHWRFPAVAGADFCPVCSVRHFPFCPPPPLPPHPFPYDLQPPPPPPPPNPFPYDFHPPPPPPLMWAPPPPGPHDPRSYDLPGWEGPHKRMRLGEAPPFDPYDFVPPPPPGRASVEGDRLLGLIRDHGRNPLPGCLPDGGFGYGGGRLYPRQGCDFADFDQKLPPPMLNDNGFGQGFVPDEGPHRKYFDGANHHFHQFHPEPLPGAPLHPPLPRYPDPHGSHAWHVEAGAVPRPAEPPFPSNHDYRAAPPRLTANSSLFPVLSGSPTTENFPSTAGTLPPAHPMPNKNRHDGHINDEGPGFIYRPQSEQNLIDGRMTSAHYSLENSNVTVINACDLFKQPLRGSRPDHIVVILRGLPGSGKSYLAKALRDLEVDNGANAPRIHSMDDYFMIEVEKKVEDTEGPKSSSASKGRRQLTKKVIEYCYEPEMEETYRSSMLKAFSKTLDEGNFTFVIGMELFRAAYINHYCPIPICNIFFSWLFLQYCGGAFKIYGLTKHFTMLYFFFLSHHQCYI
ncbi:P-loop containing nucleoside triphosphate hydrolase superfamily protein [Zea mays]|uniref:p-loop containing nucleoside triphosphate hydrolase superfamily protein n=1 Tax=Zea mays TaxID=4577 RepID=A0A1D6H729_MAIZE|nr:P-loop containing nucleoside triphosphate hydrolase superfamily protein [Zea mays]AQK70591.1 P-loop containing nucleoside triphosphate hydrolase superfamily protein [Zea mays]AQK70592.1 P-loop containing nucleoside triphosphate hydrolase superfamily protein [Zea mays]AQK70598.1 P-loop containing nucleoside triphosphate hydrolase superfamily protein [Zea mays]